MKMYNMGVLLLAVLKVSSWFLGRMTVLLFIKIHIFILLVNWKHLYRIMLSVKVSILNFNNQFSSTVS